jgi:hypothetical protein
VHVICLQETKLATPAHKRKCLLSLAIKSNIHSTRLTVPEGSDARGAKGGAVTVFTYPDAASPTAIYYDDHLVISRIV